MEPDMDFEFILARHYAELDRQDQYTDALTLPVGALPVMAGSGIAMMSLAFSRVEPERVQTAAFLE